VFLRIQVVSEVDGRGVCGWDMGVVALVSGLQLAEHNRDISYFFSAAFSSQLEVMVGGVLVRVSALNVGLGVGRVLITSGSRTRPSHSCDGWVGDLGVVGDPLIFGLARGAGAFDGGLLTFGLVSGFQIAQHDRDNCHFFSAAFSSQLEVMVDGALVKVSAFHVGFGVGGGTTIASGSCVRASHSWTSRLLTSSFSLGVSSLFCRATQCM
jgi:hypothetical protein